MAIALLTSVACAGCQTLPRSGPDDGVIKDQATLYYATSKEEKPLTNYILADLSEKLLSYFPKRRQDTFKRGFEPTRRGAPSLPIGIGDIVTVTLFESSAGGLFIPSDAGSRPGNFITLPQQTVDAGGTISVPYAGKIRVVGRLPEAVQAEIEDKLADRAIEPQAVITLVSRQSSQASVLGDVNLPAKLELTAAGERVLDLISRAQGLSAPADETSVTLQRGKTIATVPFNALVEDPAENIFVYPNDVVYVNRERRTFIALGASGLNGRIDFEETGLTLAEGIGKAGGLLDARADPSEVFLYRLVPVETLAKMGTPVSVKTGPLYPMIIRVDLRDPSTLFLAQRLQMEDKDILYVSNADSVELTKVFDIINTVSSGTTGPVRDVAAGRTAARVVGR